MEDLRDCSKAQLPVWGLAGAGHVTGQYVKVDMLEWVRRAEIEANGWYWSHQTEKDNISGKIESKAQQDNDEKMLCKP